MSPENGHANPDVRLAPVREHAERLSERLPGLLVQAERVASTVAQGVHGRRRTGVGETFWQFRLYQTGDSAKDIDWRQSARSRHLFVREQEWEAAQSVWIWCDLSRSMRFASHKRLQTKLDRAVLLTLALGAMLVRGGERVALLMPGERPRGGRQGLNALSRALASAETTDEALPPPVELPRFGRLVLISDFLEPVDVLRDRLGPHVGRAIGGSLLQILDPAEETLPYEGRVLFEGLEAEGLALVRNVGSVRQRYRSRLEAHEESLKSLVSRWGWRVATHRTDRAVEAALLTLYQMLAPRALR
jgi:uncharacterized protein (DUF58 family)